MCQGNCKPTTLLRWRHLLLGVNANLAAMFALVKQSVRKGTDPVKNGRSAGLQAIRSVCGVNGVTSGPSAPITTFISLRIPKRPVR